ncbi:hypothetical protein EC971742_2507 [Escherichia coli 97.1742]|nr:hypothetical protein EC971742_2507 [Escherichia coli 97.1742]
MIIYLFLRNIPAPSFPALHAGERLNHPWLTLSVALSTLLLSVLLWVFIPKGFFPVQDNGIIQGFRLLCQ